jgi:uncharacterized protein (TIGR02301 family)
MSAALRGLAVDRRVFHNRGMNRFARILAVILLAHPLVGAAFAQESASEPPPPIYEDKLLRLAEILGSLSFLRNLCGEKDGSAWRDEMDALLVAENPSPQRRQRLVARFNHGFETFGAVYRSCTPSADLAIRRYLKEGEELAGEVRSRYSQ